MEVRSDPSAIAPSGGRVRRLALVVGRFGVALGVALGAAFAARELVAFLGIDLTRAARGVLVLSVATSTARVLDDWSDDPSARVAGIAWGLLDAVCFVALAAVLRPGGWLVALGLAVLCTIPALVILRVGGHAARVIGGRGGAAGPPSRMPEE